MIIRLKDSTSTNASEPIMCPICRCRLYVNSFTSHVCCGICKTTIDLGIDSNGMIFIKRVVEHVNLFSLGDDSNGRNL